MFNLKYQRLCESVRDKLQVIGEENQDDPEIQVCVRSFSRLVERQGMSILILILIGQLRATIMC